MDCWIVKLVQNNRNLIFIKVQLFAVDFLKWILFGAVYVEDTLRIFRSFFCTYNSEVLHVAHSTTLCASDSRHIFLFLEELRRKLRSHCWLAWYSWCLWWLFRGGGSFLCQVCFAAKHMFTDGRAFFGFLCRLRERVTESLLFVLLVRVWLLIKRWSFSCITFHIKAVHFQIEIFTKLLKYVMQIWFRS